MYFFPIQIDFDPSWGWQLLKFGCFRRFEWGYPREFNSQHLHLGKCMDRGCLSLRRVKPHSLAEKKLRAFLLIQKKVVFVSQIKVWSCRWACKMPSASPSSPGSCNALIHQNQSHFHELVIGFLAASGQIMSLFLHADISALVSEANDADCLVNRLGCFWYRAGWQQINSYCGDFVWSPARITPRRLWRRDLLPSSRERSFPREKKKKFQSGLNASVTTVESTDGPVHVVGWPQSHIPARIMQDSWSSNWNSGPWEAPQSVCPPVLFVTCTQCWEMVQQQQECRMCPVEHPTEGRQPGCPGMGVWGRTFSIPLSLKASQHCKRQSTPPPFSAGEMGCFIPLLWRSSADFRASSDFCAQAELSVCSSVCSHRWLLWHWAWHGPWAPGLAALVLCFGAWNVIIVILLLSYLPWVLCLPSQPLGWAISAYKVPLASSGSSWSVWLNGLSWWEIPRAACVNWVFPFVPSKFTGNYWLTPLLLCYGMVGKERDWSIFSTLPCRVNDILFSCITGERKRSFFITSLINS